ncbi:MAG: glycosyltransferase [Candidatus Bathyarchaeota archaeon]|nr:MAG: glycosyltransferase [Candidatus Bathyarchaeota archaeon]
MIVVTVPAYNESRNLKKCVELLLQETLPLGEEFCIVIAEDGSTDGTDIIAQSLERMYPTVIHLCAARKLGRGLALKRAWNKVEGDIYVYIDCDLATNMKYYPRLINLIREGNDLATGSRYIEGAKVHRPLLRELTSRLYNTLIRMMFKDHVFDHQIGFKAFSNRLIRDTLNKCKSAGWFWDTEIIVRSIHSNYKCVEFPVEWEEKKREKTSMKRLITDVMIHGVGLSRLKSYLLSK